MFSFLISLLAQVFLVVLLVVLVGGAIRALEWLGAHGVGHWLLSPFRAWTGLNKTRGPKL